ncbi:MAG TPA: hypothetical protein VMF90_06705 [Rhizobiaceae bacterium]|nr:hypothetical protein [Rhizobiaceae bacterium]
MPALHPQATPLFRNLRGPSTQIGAIWQATRSDFNVGNDTIELHHLAFTKIGAVGAFKASAFKLSTQVKDADDRIIYNKTTGGVFYDRDGSGAAAPVLFVTLLNRPIVTAADFQSDLTPRPFRPCGPAAQIDAIWHLFSRRDADAPSA